MGPVPFDNHVEFCLSQGTLVKLALFSVENRDDLVVSGPIGHVYVALEVPHQKAVLLLQWILSHDQMLIV